MVLKFINSMGRKKKVFKPIKKGEVTMYSCGPTVYDYAHLGHFRAYVFVDVLRRVLRLNGFKIKAVMNITDVGHLTSDADTGEDKIEKKARLEKKTAWDIAEFYTKDFFEAMEKLNVAKPDIVCKATEHIPEMIEMIEKIEKNGYTYRTSDGIYFDTSKISDYGKLSGMTRDKLKKVVEGARVEINPEKKNPTDFALWKFSPKDVKRHMEWPSKWGVGFPGWHIECSAMSMKYLGEVFDIHTGGYDHLPIHHPNEIAQAKAATGKDFVKYWLHENFLMVDGQKMSKSKGNFYTMKDIEERSFNPLAVRYLLLTAHYRSKMNFTWKSLEAAQKALSTLREYAIKLKEPDKRKIKKEKVKQFKKEFLEAVNDDLNTPLALSILWKMIREEKDINNKDKRKLLLKFDDVLGLKLKEVKEKKVEIPDEVKKLIEDRETARKNGDYKTSDEIRKKLKEEFGIILEDTPKGVKWKKIR